VLRPERCREDKVGVDPGRGGVRDEGGIHTAVRDGEVRARKFAAERGGGFGSHDEMDNVRTSGCESWRWETRELQRAPASGLIYLELPPVTCKHAG
jgi:hypothetical protein